MSQAIDFDRLFNDSYESITGNSDAFFPMFYRNFLSSSPSIADAFRDTDMDKQVMMLQKAIVYLVNFFATRKAGPLLSAMSRRHAALGIGPELYDLFIDSFLKTLSELDPNYCRDCGIAWRITLAPGIEFMKHYGEDAP